MHISNYVELEAMKFALRKNACTVNETDVLSYHNTKTIIMEKIK